MQVIAVIIFILKISETKAPCYWNDCLIYCGSMDAASIFAPIEKLYAEAQKELCHDEFTLRLQPLTYPNNTIDSFWFTANVTVTALEVNFNEVAHLSADAFNVHAFQRVKTLTFQTFGLPLIVNGTLNGLDALEVINIRSAMGVSTIEAGVLDSLTKLQEFTFEESAPRSNLELNINGLTGSAVLSKLEYVKIRYNLASSIKKSTFSGLRNVKRLDLSSCQINSIEDNSFDPISETIEELDLSGNALTTVAYGVFSMVLPNIKTINVNGNRWDCVCALKAFRLFIEQYRENFIGFECASPIHCSLSNILESDCFDTCDIPSTTTPDTTTTTTTTTTTASPDTNLIVECPNDLAILDTVSIELPIGYMAISENEYGETNLSIETELDANSMVVIRFNEKDNSGEIDGGNGIHCLSRSNVSSIPITDLKSDVTYSFCLMRKTSTSVSPLDCISYTKRQDQVSAVWLRESSKILTITLAVVFLLLSIFLGLVITFCSKRHNPFTNHNSQQFKMSKEPRDALSYGANRNRTDKPSNIYTMHTMQEQADISSQNDTAVNCPPLPEWSLKLYDEEPVYESIQ